MRVLGRIIILTILGLFVISVVGAALMVDSWNKKTFPDEYQQ